MDFSADEILTDNCGQTHVFGEDVLTWSNNLNANRFVDATDAGDRQNTPKGDDLKEKGFAPVDDTTVDESKLCSESNCTSHVKQTVTTTTVTLCASLDETVDLNSSSEKDYDNIVNQGPDDLLQSRLNTVVCAGFVNLPQVLETQCTPATHIYSSDSFPVKPHRGQTQMDHPKPDLAVPAFNPENEKADLAAIELGEKMPVMGHTLDKQNTQDKQEEKKITSYDLSISQPPSSSSRELSNVPTQEKADVPTQKTSKTSPNKASKSPFRRSPDASAQTASKEPPHKTSVSLFEGHSAAPTLRVSEALNRQTYFPTTSNPCAVRTLDVSNVSEPAPAAVATEGNFNIPIIQVTGPDQCDDTDISPSEHAFNLPSSDIRLSRTRRPPFKSLSGSGASTEDQDSISPAGCPGDSDTDRDYSGAAKGSAIWKVSRMENGNATYSSDEEDLDIVSEVTISWRNTPGREKTGERFVPSTEDGSGTSAWGLDALEDAHQEAGDEDIAAAAAGDWAGEMPRGRANFVNQAPSAGTRRSIKDLTGHRHGGVYVAREDLGSVSSDCSAVVGQFYQNDFASDDFLTNEQNLNGNKNDLGFVAPCSMEAVLQEIVGEFAQDTDVIGNTSSVGTWTEEETNNVLPSLDERLPSGKGSVSVGTDTEGLRSSEEWSEDVDDDGAVSHSCISTNGGVSVGVSTEDGILVTSCGIQAGGPISRSNHAERSFFNVHVASELQSSGAHLCRRSYSKNAGIVASLANSIKSNSDGEKLSSSLDETPNLKASTEDFLLIPPDIPVCQTEALLSPEVKFNKNLEGSAEATPEISDSNISIEDLDILEGENSEEFIGPISEENSLLESAVFDQSFCQSSGEEFLGLEKEKNAGSRCEFVPQDQTNNMSGPPGAQGKFPSSRGDDGQLLMNDVEAPFLRIMEASYVYREQNLNATFDERDLGIDGVDFGDKLSTLCDDSYIATISCQASEGEKFVHNSAALSNNTVKTDQLSSENRICATESRSEQDVGGAHEENANSPSAVTSISKLNHSCNATAVMLESPSADETNSCKCSQQASAALDSGFCTLFGGFSSGSALQNNENSFLMANTDNNQTIRFQIQDGSFFSLPVNAHYITLIKHTPQKESDALNLAGKDSECFSSQASNDIPLSEAMETSKQVIRCMESSVFEINAQSNHDENKESLICYTEDGREPSRAERNGTLSEALQNLEDENGLRNAVSVDGHAISRSILGLDTIESNSFEHLNTCSNARDSLPDGDEVLENGNSNQGESTYSNPTVEDSKSCPPDLADELAPKGAAAACSGIGLASRTVESYQDVRRDRHCPEDFDADARRMCSSSDGVVADDGAFSASDEDGAQAVAVAQATQQQGFSTLSPQEEPQATDARSRILRGRNLVLSSLPSILIQDFSGSDPVQHDVNQTTHDPNLLEPPSPLIISPPRWSCSSGKAVTASFQGGKGIMFQPGTDADRQSGGDNSDSLVSSSPKGLGDSISSGKLYSSDNLDLSLDGSGRGSVEVTTPRHSTPDGSMKELGLTRVQLARLPENIDTQTYGQGQVTQPCLYPDSGPDASFDQSYESQYGSSYLRHSGPDDLYSYTVPSPQSASQIQMLLQQQAFVETLQHQQRLEEAALLGLGGYDSVLHPDQQTPRRVCSDGQVDEMNHSRGDNSITDDEIEVICKYNSAHVIQDLFSADGSMVPTAGNLTADLSTTGAMGERMDTSLQSGDSLAMPQGAHHPVMFLQPPHCCLTARTPELPQGYYSIAGQTYYNPGSGSYHHPVASAQTPPQPQAYVSRPSGYNSPTLHADFGSHLVSPQFGNLSSEYPGSGSRICPDCFVSAPSPDQFDSSNDSFSSRFGSTRDQQSSFQDSSCSSSSFSDSTNGGFQSTTSEPQAFIYPSIYVSHAGLMTVLLKNDVSVEMTVDRTIRVVSHQRKMAIGSSARGTSSCLYHPAVRIMQNTTTTEVEMNEVQAKMTTDSIVFANDTSCYKFDYNYIEPASPNFTDISKDSSVNLLFSSEGYGPSLVANCLEMASKAEYENLPKGGVIVRINGIKITQGGRGDVTVVTGPKFIKLSPNTGVVRLQTHFLEVCVEKDWNVKMRRGTHTLCTNYGKFILSNGKIEAGFDENGRLKVYTLPRRTPLPVGNRRQRRPGGTPRRKATALGGVA